MSACIYLIHSTHNPEKYYIGSAIIFAKRKAGHIYELNKNKHHCKYLQRSINKYGKDTFKFYILEEVKDLSKLLDREDYYLQDFFWFDDELYNINFVAGSRLFTKHSKETRIKLSLIRIGKEPWNKGKKLGPRSKETREKISKNNCKYWLGKKRSKENIEKNKESQPSTPFIIGKKKYKFLSDAAKKLGVSYPTISRRLKSKYFPEYQYI